MSEPDQTADSVAIHVLRLNDHLYGFYAGRDSTAGDVTSWVEEGALSLGICSYAVIDGAEALVFDTGVSIGHGRAMRDKLENLGANRITVVLSHWHLDHVAGNAAFGDCEIVASPRTAELLEKHRSAIESGTLEGPPAIRPLVMPTRTTRGDHDTLRVGSLEVELLRFEIHSDDATVIRLPSLGALLAADTVEDTITYVTEPDRVSTHISELERLRELGAQQIFPSHGSLERIQTGGYGEGLIVATRDYLSRLKEATADPARRALTLQEFVRPELERGWIGYFAPYERVHQENLDMMSAGRP